VPVFQNRHEEGLQAVVAIYDGSVSGSEAAPRGNVVSSSRLFEQNEQ
jgi:hypothetical protein